MRPLVDEESIAATKKPACGGRRASAERLEPLLGACSLGGVRGIARGQIQEARRWAGHVFKLGAKVRAWKPGLNRLDHREPPATKSQPRPTAS